MFMAPFQLASISLLLTCTPHPTFIFKNPRLSVFAKKDDDSLEKDTGNSTPFRFNFGNLPNVRSVVPAAAPKPSSSGLSFGRRKDPGTVFVAGATGQVGIRIAQTLLRQGFCVRAAVPDIGTAQELAQLAVEYKVTKSQIASVVADIFSNTSVAQNKVVKVYTDASASANAISELFRAVPEDGRRKAYAEAQEKAKLEEEAIKATEQATKAVQKLKEETSSAAIKTQKSAEPGAGPSVENIFDKAKDITSGFIWEKFSSQLKIPAQKPKDEEPKVQVATVRGQAKARSLPSLKAIVKFSTARQPPPPKSKVAGKHKAKKPALPPTETRKFFGGLFSQETVYVDDA